MNDTTQAGGWPAVQWETLHWAPSITSGFSRTQRQANSGPYRAALVPSIAEQSISLQSEVLAEAEEAAAEIARFDAHLTARLDQRGTGLTSELGPMDSILLRTESASSSQIEHLTVGARQLALAEIGESGSANARLVAKNVAVLRAALAVSENMDRDALLVLHHTLLAESDPDHAGRLRTQQVWIGGDAAGPHRAMFVPPRHSHVSEALDDLFVFADRTDLPILPQAAIAHAQFETIHPFTDGNGRTGRALVHAMMRGKGLTRRVTVPVSAGLLTDLDGYFGALDAYREGQIAPIVQQFSRAALVAIANGTTLLAELDKIQQGWAERIQARRSAAAWRVADLVLAHPVLTAALVARELSVSAPTAQSAIQLLADARILTMVKSQRRNRVWQAREVLTALDDFAARSGRRTQP